jgi:hypothetical protein
MMLKFLVLIVIACIAGCQLSSSQSSTIIPSTPDLSPTPSDGWAVHDGTEIGLKIKIPYGWETYNTESGIVLTEHMGNPETGGVLEGILIYIFIPPHMTDIRVHNSESENIAWQMLKQIISKREYIGDALVSEPVAFDWDHHDAAYYLLNNRDGTVTLLLAMGLADDQHLVVSHISLPQIQANRLRPLLPELLGSLTIDDIPVDVTALNHLPDPLIFPVYAVPTP